MKEQTEVLLALLQDKAKEVNLHDYAEVFSNQANSHSSWGRKFGSAQKWLIATVIFTGFFLVFIYNIDIFFPIKTATLTLL